jgi:hypothetical protein
MYSRTVSAWCQAAACEHSRSARLIDTCEPLFLRALNLLTSKHLGPTRCLFGTPIIFVGSVNQRRECRR